MFGGRDLLVVLSITTMITAWCELRVLAMGWLDVHQRSLKHPSAEQIEAARPRRHRPMPPSQGEPGNSERLFRARSEGGARARAPSSSERFTDQLRDDVTRLRFLKSKGPTAVPFWDQAVRPAWNQPVPPPRTSAPTAASLMRSIQPAGRTTTPFSRCSSRWCCSSPAASTRLGSPRTQWIFLGVAMVFLIAGTIILATFPIDI